MENIVETENKVVETPKKGRVFTRDSNIELLRIICMIFIIFHHFSCHSGIVFTPDDFSFNRFLNEFFYSGGKVGVDVFVLITGFFMYKADGIKFDRILKLWLQLFTISLGCYLVFLSCGRYEFSWTDLLHKLLPVTFEDAWFVSAFFVLTLLITPLNVMIKHITQKRHLILILIGTVLWSVIPTFIFDKTYFFSNWEYNSIIWFMYLYVVGAYIAKYGFGRKEHKASFYLLLNALIFAITYGFTILFIFLGKDNSYFYDNIEALFQMQTLPVMAMSVLLLVGFSKLKIKQSKVINYISATTFGIYLIHDNSYIRDWLWLDVVKGLEHQTKPDFILIALIAGIAVFVGCSLIEIIRQQTLERLYKKPLAKLCEKLNNGLKKAMPDKQKTVD